MKKKFPRLLSAAFFLTALTGCTHTMQATSGESYLARYSDLHYTPSRTVVSDGKTAEVKTLDQRLREAASVEPILTFPARIGIARIDEGRLTVVPASEAEGWDKAKDKLGPDFGEFVPVNPMIAHMTAAATGGGQGYRGGDDVIDEIRLGAARQHLDAVLIYEVVSRETTRSNLLAMGNATIIGAYILPSQLKEAEGYADAMLIDVMQGYPYGTVTTVVNKKSHLSSSWGWGSTDFDRQSTADAIKTKAAWQLSEEAYTMFVELRDKLKAAQSAKAAAKTAK